MQINSPMCGWIDVDSIEQLMKPSWCYTIITFQTSRLNRFLDVVDIIEIEEIVVLVAFFFESIRIVDAERVRKFTVRLQRTRFVGEVLQDDVRLFILEISQTQEYDIPGVHPHLLSHLTANVTQALHPIDALRLQTPVPEHAQHLRVLLTVLLEDELSLLVSTVTLPAAAVLTALTLGVALRHLSLLSRARIARVRLSRVRRPARVRSFECTKTLKKASSSSSSSSSSRGRRLSRSVRCSLARTSPVSRASPLVVARRTKAAHVVVRAPIPPSAGRTSIENDGAGRWRARGAGRAREGFRGRGGLERGDSSDDEACARVSGWTVL